MAIKKWCSDLCFDDPNMLTNCGLSQTQDLSGSLQTPFLSDSNDGDESFHRQVELAHVAPVYIRKSQTIHRNALLL
jgi:hypothetical protein